MHSFIHHWVPFTLYLAVGLGQIVAAVYGGAVSAMSLEHSKRRKHKIWFVALGLCLSFFTVWAGKVADDNQFNSENDAKDARSELRQVREGLEKSQSTLNQSLGALAELKVTVQQGSYPPNLRLTIVKAIQSLEDRVTQGQYASRSLGPTSSPPPSQAIPNPSTMTPQAGQRSSYAQIVAIDGSLRDLVMNLNVLDSNTRETNLEILREKLRRDRTIGNSPEVLQSIQMQAVRNRVARLDQFRRQYEGQIRSVRDRALSSLNLSTSERTADDTTFENILKRVYADDPAIEQLDNGLGASPRFREMEDYLSGLTTRLERLSLPKT